MKKENYMEKLMRVVKNKESNWIWTLKENSIASIWIELRRALRVNKEYLTSSTLWMQHSIHRTWEKIQQYKIECQESDLALLMMIIRANLRMKTEKERESQKHRSKYLSKSCSKILIGQMKMWREFQKNLAWKKLKYTNGIGIKRRS